MRIVFHIALLLGRSDAFGIPNFMHSRAATIRLRRSNQFVHSAEPSLADMEDDVERKLDKAEPLESLQHTFRAPSKLQQSSKSYSVQESTFKDEDMEAVKRQQTIKKLLDEDDAKWKEQRRRKIMGKYADAKTEEEIQRIRDEEDRKLDEGE